MSGAVTIQQTALTAEFDLPPNSGDGNWLLKDADGNTVVTVDPDLALGDDAAQEYMELFKQAPELQAEVNRLREQVRSQAQNVGLVSQGDGLRAVAQRLADALRAVCNSADDKGCDGCYVVDGAVIEDARGVLDTTAKVLS